MLTADRFISARFRWIATASRATWAPGRAWFAAANGAARKKTTAPRTAEATTGSARTRLSGRCFLPRRVDHERVDARLRSEEHTSELQSLMRISYAVFCLKKKKT